ncbi:MAG: hypothetical protein NC548_12920 [Lachnospiraceae bacterium]|nr:hypothetical protein [Lachnospiraceae bacterium]MCM1230707.1 hypothetical protein [Ruminococcus flavefaciens]
MTVFHPGDLVLIYNKGTGTLGHEGDVATFLSYYPTLTDGEEPSNFHSCIISAPWIKSPNSDEPGTLKFNPAFLIKVNSDTIPGNLHFKSEEEQKELDKVVESDIQRIITNRSEAGVSLCDQMINRAVDRYMIHLEKDFPEIKGEFYKRCQEAILQKDKLYDGDTTFREHLRYAMQNLADKYIKEHEDELKDLMKDSIEVAATHLMQDELSKKIGSKMSEYIQSLF